MVPTKTDPIWKKFVNSEQEYSFSCLATKMMYTRIKQMMRNKDAAIEAEAVDIVHSFFEKNINIVQADLNLIK